MIAHSILAILFAGPMATTLVDRRASNTVSQGPMLCAVDFGIADDGERTSREQEFCWRMNRSRVIPTIHG